MQKKVANTQQKGRADSQNVSGSLQTSFGGGSPLRYALRIWVFLHNASKR